MSICRNWQQKGSFLFVFVSSKVASVSLRGASVPGRGSVASFGTEQEFEEKTSFPETLGVHFEEFVDEPILTLDVIPAQPPYLTLPNDVHRLIV